jgi:hypothetical protein
MMPPIHKDAAPCGSVLNPCVEAQPTSPLHKGPPTTVHFTHVNSGPASDLFSPQPINSLLLGIEPETLGMLPGHLNH